MENDLRIEMQELRGDVRVLSADMRTYMQKISEALVSQARTEEKVLSVMEDNSRVADDVKDFTARIVEVEHRCKKHEDSISDLKSSLKTQGERFESIRDEFKAFKTQVVTYGIVAAFVLTFASNWVAKHI